jgi:hypothetical protein
VYPIYMASIETDAPRSQGNLAPLLALGLLAASGAAGLLWWRFGEAVYTSSIMTAILACF